MGRVQVAIRTRPTATFAEDCIQVDDDKLGMTVKLPKGGTHGSDNQQDTWSWKYDAILHNASQETVYRERVAPIVQSVVQGYHGTVMSYGQTGAGKTFTTVGSTQGVYAYRGIAPRACAEVFQYLQDHPHLEAEVFVSYLEIYNDALVDLLASLPSAEPQAAHLHLIEDHTGSTHVKGLRIEKVTSEEEALNLLFEGESHRVIANHQLNRTSTRGHAIFTVYVQIRSRVESSDKVVRSKLHLVDLAGSERLKKTDTVGELRAESMYINRSLSYLEQVVVSLAQRGRTHTPYRQSKLTHLLKDALGGNCKTLLIANIYGEATHIEETISTLQFAARVRAVTNEATINEHADPELLLKRCTAEIANLKRELAMHDSLSNRSKVQYEPYSESQRGLLSQELQQFLDHKTEEVPFESVRQMRELLLSARSLFGKKQSELDEAHRALAQGGGTSAPAASTAHEASGAAADSADAVGDSPDVPRGHSLGKAPDGARPPNGVLDPPGSAAHQMLNSGLGDSPSAGYFNGMTSAGGDTDAPPLGRAEAYGQFKTTNGLMANEKLLESKAALKAVRARRLELTTAVNKSAQVIGGLTEQLMTKKSERDRMASTNTGTDIDVIDEEEYSIIQNIKAYKKGYKETREQLMATNEAVQEAANSADESRQELMRQFDDWCALSLGDSGALPMAIVTRPTTSADPMDEDEQFEQMQMARVMAEEPESLAYVRARASMSSRERKSRR